jgi:hypothetical protein
MMAEDANTVATRLANALPYIFFGQTKPYPTTRVALQSLSFSCYIFGSFRDEPDKQCENGRMAQQTVDELQRMELIETRSEAIAWSALAFAFLQSVCATVIAASGMRSAIGLAAFITSIATSAPSQDLHRVGIRLPMLIFALAGAAINFAVLWQVRRLRRRPSAQWRLTPISARKQRMEQFTFWVSVLTVLLVFAELIAHKRIHGFYF